jgi:acetyltransferase-like isoleucine patch superfamily enzyme
VSIGAGCFLNLHTMIASQDEVTIGDHTMFANHCFVSDSSHRYDDRTMPVTWQGFTSKGPTRIGSNCWFGVGCVITSGVTIGDRCVVGANSVVTRDLPPGVIAAGAPAKIIREIDFGPAEDATRLATS